MIKIGKAGNNICFDVLYRENKEAGDYWDGNRLTTKIAINAGAWQGSCRASLRAEEFVSLKNNLEKLYKNPEYSFGFEPMEPWIRLKFTGSKTGQIEIQGEANDEPATGNVLKFHFEIDQTFLPEIIKDVQSVNEKFPILGQP